MEDKISLQPQEIKDKINKMVDDYCKSMNDICWYSNGYYWDRVNLLDVDNYECRVSGKCPSLAICRPCKELKKSFHDRVDMMIKLNKSKTERKWKKVSLINSQ